MNQESAMRIKMTTKRQATFPRKLCEEMRLEPGHAIKIEPAVLDGRRVWVLSAPPEPPDMGWVGSLRRYAAGSKLLSMEAVRAKIVEGMANGDLD
jgi:bifunctional DNA-binding transcriptional regulator/antitoxin component of YhaV-PrlF toxin-antitoxin module